MKFALGLSAKLLLMTIAFVMVAEVLIFVPSVANFRRNWLMRRVVAAKIASLALEASKGAELPERLRQELLRTAGVHAVSLKRTDFRKLVLGMPDAKPIPNVYDLRSQNYIELMRDGLAVFIEPTGRLIRVVASPDMAPNDEVDVVIDETPLHAAVWQFAANIFWLSLIISVITAASVYLALNALFVRPMRHITRNMVLYRENPEDYTRVIAPSNRRDEIGIAEKELATLQTQLSGLLKEKVHLANVGLAVSKISHDLRGVLSSAQLVSDRLATIPDPTVQRVLPRLMRALDRAIALCTNTLKYGRSEEAPPKLAEFALRPLLIEVKENLVIDESRVTMQISMPSRFDLLADRDQIFRVLTNLIRNSLEALRDAEPPPKSPAVTVQARQEGETAIITVSDNGPGIPVNVRPNLFQAFQTGAKSDGIGLGLVISAELVRAHGGEIRLEDTPVGASFVVRLPNSIRAGRRVDHGQGREAENVAGRV